jgi:hypothetical protein
LDSIRSSYDFHLKLEPFLAFIHREWRTIAVSSCAFAVIMLAGIVLIDPAFFYPRLQTDPLNYYLKAQAFAQTGSTSATWAVNLRPFPYAAMPGLLRVPAVFLFSEFDNQLRAMQVINIPIVASVALMSAYILSWVLPQRHHRAAIVFAFAFTLLSPVWIANVFLPLADAPYAAFTLGAILLAVGILCSEKSLWQRPLALTALALLFAMSFALRFTAPVLLAFGAFLVAGRWRERKPPPHLMLLTVAIVTGALLLLVRMNAQAIFGRYLREPLFFINRADKGGLLLNLLAAALPSQIIPNFVSGFVHPPIEAHIGTKFGIWPVDTVWMVIGLVVSAVIVAGIWSARHRLVPEIAYFLLPLPLLGLILPSTTRYLMSYQPFVWIFFCMGMIAIARRWPGIGAVMRNRTAVTAVALVMLATAVGIRAWRVAGTSSERGLAVSMSAAPRYVSDVATTFRGLRRFIESLPRDSTLLVGERTSMGRWKAIAGRDSYYPDSALSRTAQARPVYLLVECGTMEVCQGGWSYYDSVAQSRVKKFGAFRFDSVFALESPRARVEVYRIHPIGIP